MKLRKEDIKEIGIFRALQLGDMLCIIPAIRALRSAYPKARITIIGVPWAKSLVERFPDYFDSFIHFPGYPGLPEQVFDPNAFTTFLSKVQNKNFDLVLQMQGNGSIVNPMVELFGARHVSGFFKKDHYYPRNGLFIEYPDQIHEIKRHLALINYLGINSKGTGLEFPIKDRDLKDLENTNIRIAKPYICIHPGSRGLDRRWAPKNFALVADICADKGYEIVITGTKEELNVINNVVDNMKNSSIIAAGKTSLGAVAVLIKNSRALISNCTGVSHIASALKTPSVIISMDGEMNRWAPLNKNLHKTIDWIKTPEIQLVIDDTIKILNKNQKKSNSSLCLS